MAAHQIKRKDMKILLLTTLLTTGCGFAIGTAAVYKGSQALNHIGGGVDGLGLTEQCYLEGDTFSNSIEPWLYAPLLPADVILTPVREWNKTPSEYEFSLNHCKNYDDTAYPSKKVRGSYGGADYCYFSGDCDEK